MLQFKLIYKNVYLQDCFETVVLYFVEICGIEMCELIIRICYLRGTPEKFADLR